MWPGSRVECQHGGVTLQVPVVVPADQDWLEILEHYLYVESGLDSSHTHGVEALHLLVPVLGHHGSGVVLPVAVVLDPSEQQWGRRRRRRCFW